MLQHAVADPASAQPSEILSLQRSHGNAAVQRLLAGRAALVTPATRRPRPPLPIQAKLNVGPAADAYELEADRVAEQVLALPVAQPASARPAVQRAPKEEEEIQTKPLAVTITPLVQRAAPEEEDEQAVQAKRQDPRAGFEAGRGIEDQLHAQRGNGSPLPADVRAYMEPRFGADFSGVRVHPGGEASQLNRQLSAQAFTHGQDIYLGNGRYDPGSSAGRRLLAHELTHVVQQTGRAQRKLAGGGVIQRIFGIGKKKPSSRVETTADYRTAAQAYEKKLGFFCYNHAKAKAAAQAGVDRMKQVLLGDVKENNPMFKSAIMGAFGRRNKDSAGQVGQKFDEVMAVLTHGNLREQMTAFYNTSLTSFKRLITDLMSGKQWGEKGTLSEKERWTKAEEMGLNVKELKGRKSYMDSSFRGMLGQAEKWKKGKAEGFAKDLFAMDPRKMITSGQGGLITASSARAPAMPPGQAPLTSGRTVGELEQGGAGLSDREKALMFGDRGTGNAPGTTSTTFIDQTEFGGPDIGDVSKEKLSWAEGGTFWKMNQDASWYKKVHDQMGMPVVAGPSGTTDRLLDVYKWLKVPVPPEDFRLALMGWMMTSNDHSFHEIMSMAATKGLSLDYKAGPEAYRHIKPLTIIELRANVADHGNFPDESAYVSKMQRGEFMMGGQEETEQLEEATDPSDFDSPQKKQEKHEMQARMGSGGGAAVAVYTGPAYLFQNPMMMRLPNFIKKFIIKYQIAYNPELLGVAQAMKDQGITVDVLMREAKTHNSILLRALKEMPPWSGRVFRGTWIGTKLGWGVGSTHKMSGFTSTSRDQSTAEGFVQSKPVISGALFKMDVTTGLNIKALSMAGGEDEILLPPGVVFTVTKPPTKPKGEKYYEIEMNQTGGGIGSADIGTVPPLPQTEEEENEQDTQEAQTGTQAKLPDSKYFASTPEGYKLTLMMLMSIGMGMPLPVAITTGVPLAVFQGLSPDGKKELGAVLHLTVDEVTQKITELGGGTGPQVAPTGPQAKLPDTKYYTSTPEGYKLTHLILMSIGLGMPLPIAVSTGVPLAVFQGLSPDGKNELATALKITVDEVTQKITTELGGGTGPQPAPTQTALTAPPPPPSEAQNVAPPKTSDEKTLARWFSPDELKALADGEKTLQDIVSESLSPSTTMEDLQGHLSKNQQGLEALSRLLGGMVSVQDLKDQIDQLRET